MDFAGEAKLDARGLERAAPARLRETRESDTKPDGTAAGVGLAAAHEQACVVGVRERSLEDVGEVAAIEDDGHARAGGANAIGHLLAPNEIPPAHLGWVQPELGGKQVERALAHEANLEEARTP